MDHTPIHLDKIRRITVVGPQGIVYENYDLYADTEGADLLLQDEGATLKILPTKRPEPPKPVRILITGSRHHDNHQLIAQAISEAIDGLDMRHHPHLITIVHGGASGADHLADEVAAQLGLRTEIHPAQWQALGRKAGPIRNQQMVDRGADLCLAFPQGQSNGTRGCMRAAEKAGIPVRCIES